MIAPTASIKSAVGLMTSTKRTVFLARLSVSSEDFIARVISASQRIGFQPSVASPTMLGQLNDGSMSSLISGQMRALRLVLWAYSTLDADISGDAGEVPSGADLVLDGSHTNDVIDEPPSDGAENPVAEFENEAE